MSEAFVYCWTNHTTNRIYVGYHKGSINDGYVCSSKSDEFWNDFKNAEHKWSRQIIGEGTVLDCKKLELEILRGLDLNEAYNNGYGPGVIHTAEVREKISKSKRGELNPSKKYGWKISQSLKGRKLSEEHIKRRSESQKGSKRSEETKMKISAAKKGKAFTDDHKLSISKSKKDMLSKMSKEEKKEKMGHRKGKTWQLIDGKRVWMEKKQ